MTIVFHCQKCSRKIEAKDSAGGKWGRCPACRNKVYIPDLSAGDDMKLAPVDQSEERRKQRMMRETRQLTQNIQQQKETPETPSQDAPAAPSGPVMRIPDSELRENIINYLRARAAGEDEAAQDYITVIAAGAQRAEKLIDQIALSDIPEPELKDIPQQELAGLLRELRAQIS